MSNRTRNDDTGSVVPSALAHTQNQSALRSSVVSIDFISSGEVAQSSRIRRSLRLLTRSHKEPQQQNNVFHVSEPHARPMLFATALGLILGGAAVALIVRFGGRKPPASTAEDNDMENKIPARFTPREIELRYNCIRKALGDYSSSHSFVDPGSPQSRAVEWLAHEDGLIDFRSCDSEAHRVRTRYALMCFAYGTQGDYWPVEPTWSRDGSRHECNWARIECGDAHEVQILDLEQLGISANNGLPSDLALVMGIRGISLMGNRIEGSMPSGILLMSGLEFLSLAGNEMTGSIPREISRLSQLSYLALSDSGLTGFLPSSMSDLSNLEYLSIDSTRIGGGLLEMAVASWPKLITLHADTAPSVSGTIPNDIHRLSSLQDLRLGYTGIAGSIPTTIGLLTELEILQIAESSGGFNSVLPSELGLLSRLQYLGVYQVNLHGTIPSTLNQLVHLERLVLRGNSLTGTLPDLTLPSLFQLSVAENLLSGTIPTSLLLMTSLEFLSIEHNDLIGLLPDAFCSSLPQLTQLSRDCEEVVCSCCEKLKTLDFNKCR